MSSLNIIPELESCSNIDRSVRILDLLDHTACINKTTYNWGRYNLEDSELSSLESFIRGDYKFSIDRHQSGSWMYSNVGYDILGAVIERVAGIGFEKFIQKEILGPLGMTDTVFDLNSIDESRIRFPTLFEGGEILLLGKIPNVKRHSPSAVAFSSIADISKWGRFHASNGAGCDHANISSFNRSLMWSSRVNTDITYTQSYGLGWYIGEWFGNRAVGHGGKEYGFNTFIIVFPDDDISISILMNTHNADVIKLAIEIVKTLIKSELMYNKSVN
ncbi:serine hydrolase domain-containing protein [Sessilibacter corallicola]|uniref:serine hydrolase domain-containing protein n=1 Tax=Sessilibacter corallicola TaxID=2904075 RepID=UPI001E5EBDCE|nr:serine hydrolase domain-containing protein [Sessilibacter corallicola]MCE2029447.1 beta-lactamase family protein [Sessilibacter corallicola]